MRTVRYGSWRREDKCLGCGKFRYEWEDICPDCATEKTRSVIVREVWTPKPPAKDFIEAWNNFWAMSHETLSYEEKK